MTLHPLLRKTSFSRSSIKGEIDIFFSASIAITANTGVGKSTTLRNLRQRFSPIMRFVSGGDLMRLRAEQFGFPNIESFANYNKLHPEDGHDQWLDSQLAFFGSQNFTVIESRLAHLVAPHAFTVKLTCPTDVRAERRLKDRPNSTFAVEKQLIVDRDADDAHRYSKLYPDCMWADDQFDLVIDTSVRSIDEVVEDIVDGHHAWVEDKQGKLCFEVIV